MSTPEDHKGQPVLPFASQEEWRTWLAGNHATSAGLWLKLAKAGTGRPSVTYLEAVEVALCFGWIDGQKGSWEGGWWIQRFTPRGPRSRWSKINRTKATALIEAGTMETAGLRQVALAKEDGRWEAAYDSPSTATVPEDLAAALAAVPEAEALFRTLTRANRYAILYRINEAKRPATREARIAKFVAMLAAGESLYPLL